MLEIIGYVLFITYLLSVALLLIIEGDLLPRRVPKKQICKHCIHCDKDILGMGKCNVFNKGVDKDHHCMLWEECTKKKGRD